MFAQVKRGGLRVRRACVILHIWKHASPAGWSIWNVTQIKDARMFASALMTGRSKHISVSGWAEEGSLAIGQRGIISQHAAPPACLPAPAWLRGDHQAHLYCSLISAQRVGGTRVSLVAPFPTDKCSSSSESWPHLLHLLPPSTHFPSILAQWADLRGWGSL